jgi:hypothetical protein
LEDVLSPELLSYAALEAFTLLYVVIPSYNVDDAAVAIVERVEQPVLEYCT